MAMSDRQTAVLSQGEKYITENDADALRVVSGSALVFVVPLMRSGTGRRMFITEVQAGETIPGFAYIDPNYLEWRFCIVPNGSCRLEILKDATDEQLREDFALTAKLSNYAEEGFNEGLVDQYRVNMLSEDNFILSNRSDQNESRAKLDNLIAESLSDEGDVSAAVNTGHALYDSAFAVCRYLGIPIAEEAHIRAATGEEYYVEDIARLSHFACREVSLTPGWHRSGGGPLIVLDENRMPRPCLPKGRGYVLGSTSVPGGGRTAEEKVTADVAAKIAPEAFMIYRPLPRKSLTEKDIAAFERGSVRKSEGIGAVIFGILTVAAALTLITSVLKAAGDVVRYGNAGKTAAFYLIAAGLTAILFVSAILFKKISGRVSRRIGNDFRHALIERLFSLPGSFFRKNDSADLARRVVIAGRGARGSALSVFGLALSAAGFAAVVSALFFLSGAVAAVVLSLSVIYGLVRFGIARRASHSRGAAENYDSRAYSLLSQYISNIDAVRTTGGEDRFALEYMKPYVLKLDNDEKKDRLLAVGNAVDLLMAGIVFTAVALMTALTVLPANIGGVDGAGYGTGYGLQLTIALLSACAAGLAGRLSSNLSAFLRHREESRLAAPVTGTEPEPDNINHFPAEFKGAIELSNVSFSYGEGLPKVLNNISFTVEPGEYVGITGPSGSGKTTLVKLLLGFEKPLSGKIYYDNTDIERLDLRELRRRAGVVLQNDKLIPGTIYDNIAFGSVDVSPERLRAAAQAAGLDKTLRSMPMGMRTIIDENGGTLSGGEREKVLLARAMLSMPRLLILDEATRALDEASRDRVRESILSMSCTRVVVTHDQEILGDCDRVITLGGD